jgi:hypothetical protein
MSVTVNEDLSGIPQGGSGGGDATWGDIQGTLSAQTDLQNALNAKVSTTGNETVAGVKTFSSAPVVSALTGDTVPYLNSSKALTSSSITPTELGHLSGVTSNIQTQIDALGGGGGLEQWEEGASGELQYQNFAAAKGTSTNPLIDLAPGSNLGAGLYTDANRSLLFASEGVKFAGYDADNNWFALYDPSNANKGILIKPGTSTGRFQLIGTSGDEYRFNFNFPPSVSSTSYMQFNMASQSEVSIFHTLQVFNSSHSSIPGLVEYSGSSTQQSQYLMVSRGGGVTIGGGVGQRADMPTLGVKAIVPYNIAGTSSVSGTTMTGSGTLYTQDLAVGDRISPDAGSTFAYVTAIASNTSATLSNTVTASGATIRRYPAIFRLQDQAKTVTMLANDQGGVIIGGTGDFSQTEKLYVGGDFKAKRTVPTVVTLTDGATVALDLSLGNHFVLTSAGDRTISIPTNHAVGQKFVIEHVASGADRTLTLTSSGAGSFRFGTDVTSLTATASGKRDYIFCVVASDSRVDVVDCTKGY